jgi:L-lactate dehydrogenase
MAPSAAPGITGGPPESAAASGTRPEGRPSKVSIVGAGAVGATTAYAMLMRGAARNVALLDINKAKVDAEVLDLQHGIQFMPQAHVEGSDDVAVCAGSDDVVVTAGAKQKPGQTRMDLAGDTITLMKRILPGLLEVAPSAIYLMVTNPVDVVTYAALRFSGLPANQLFGSGTVLDSSRLRFLVAERAGVAVQNVHAYIAGEHGDSEIPLWSSATIGGIPLRDWPGVGGLSPLTDEDLERMHHEVVHSAYEIIAGKGATNYAIALAATRIVEAILDDQHTVLPVSSLLEDYDGISDVCLSVPSVVDRTGVRETIPTPMSDDERAGLRASAAALRAAAQQFGV